LKKKYKILLIGYSNIARKRYINTFIKNDIPFCVASRSFKKKIEGSYLQFDNYDKALKYSGADIVYLSLPNSMHFNWSKKVLNSGLHLIVDKPITTKMGQLNQLIKIAKKKQLLLSEAIFFNYHKQFELIKKYIGNLSNIEQIFVNFTIPIPQKKSLLLSKKFEGGAFMDMSPYAASINRILIKENLKKKSIIIKKNANGLIISFDIFLRYKTKILNGTFKFGGDYKNELLVYYKNKSIEIRRIFSPPEDIKLKIQINKKNQSKIIIVKKDNCFENYLIEIIKNIRNKKFAFYNKNIIQDGNFRFKIIR
jgi:NDP-hexose-3-ketoreductase